MGTVCSAKNTAKSMQDDRPVRNESVTRRKPSIPISVENLDQPANEQNGNPAKASFNEWQPCDFIGSDTQAGAIAEKWIRENPRFGYAGEWRTEKDKVGTDKYWFRVVELYDMHDRPESIQTLEKPRPMPRPNTMRLPAEEPALVLKDSASEGGKNNLRDSKNWGADLDQALASSTEQIARKTSKKKLFKELSSIYDESM